KINIDTDIRLAMTGAIRKFLTENPEKFDPREFNKPAREAAKQVCRQRFEAFGSAGQADRIRAVSLDKMAARYRDGQLKQAVR
ncbi:MAG: class II fructose-bisphosphate aldolase, partial [Rhodocyclaceae bacterium]|nr:class II fructose-bisphosphate aldolase [Rhodocyclaceae bacterium]